MSTAIAMLQEPSNFTTLLKVAKWYNPEMPDSALEARVMQEIGYFEYACMLNDNLATCDPRSVMMMVRWVIQNNLSIDNQAGLVYLKTRNVKQANGGIIKVLEYEPSPEGVLSMAYSTGEIIDHKRPVVHYDGSEKPKVIGVDFSFQLSTGRWETVSYAEGHFRKWRLASHENNARGSSDGDLSKMNKANKSYTSFNGGIDPEFCTGKAIKHGLDKRGTNRIAPKRVQASVAQPVQYPYAKEVVMQLEPSRTEPEILAIEHGSGLTAREFNSSTEITFETSFSDAPTETAPAPIEAAQSAEVAQSAIPTDFTPDPIFAFLEGCSTMADLGSLFTANKEQVLASAELKAAFKKREVEINEARIAAQQLAQAAPPVVATPVAAPKITANDL